MKRWKKLHKWIGMIVGLQVLLWISGGVVMSVIPIELVRGNHLVKHLTMAAKDYQLTKPTIQFELTHWQSTQWIDRAGQLTLKVKSHVGETFYLDAHSGEQVETLSPSVLTTLAQQQYLGQGSAQTAHKLITLPQEVSHLKGTIFRVRFDDWINTDFYVDGFTGQVKSVRSDIWRVYDFFWMLHIMDYDQRKDFNNPLVILAALVALLFTLSGFVLLYFNLVRPMTIKMLRKTSLRKAWSD